jgi:FMN phosphatase YigB (HAD superfamily)
MTKNGIDLDEVDFLYSQIRSKYGGIKAFTVSTNLHYRKTLDLFNKQEFTSEFFNKVKDRFYKYKNDPETFGRIDDADREAIRICILTNYRSATAFCKKHKKFDDVYISNVICGRLKLVTPKFRRLTLILKNKYNLEIGEIKLNERNKV